MTTQPDMHSKARSLAKLGLAVFPIFGIRNGQCACGKDCGRNAMKHPHSQLAPNGFQNATTDPDTIDRWWALGSHNIGIATGPVSGITVIDIDPGHGGNQSIFNIQKNVAELPETWEVKTGSGGSHLIFEYVEGMRSRAGVIPGVDVRSDGGYIVAPPSIHLSGDRYEWVNKPTMDRSTLAVLDPQLASVFGHTKEQRPAEILPETISDGARNNWMASAAGTMRRRGFAPESIRVALHSENELKCKPPLDPEEIDRIAWSVSRYPAQAGG